MKSIQGHLILWLLATTLPLAAACGAILYFYADARLTSEFDRALLARAQLLSQSVTENDGRLDFDAPDADMGEFRRRRHPGYFEIWRSDGTVVARSGSLNGKDFFAAVPAPRRVEDVSLPDGETGRGVVLRFEPQRDEEDDEATRRAAVAQATLFLAIDRDPLDDTLGTIATSLLGAAAVMALGILVAVTLSVRRGLRPLHALAHEADAITAASLDHRFTLDRLPSELRPIGQRLNDLLNRIDQAFARERRFTADVAHELRTPIAELRTLAEVALKWPDKSAAERNFRDTLAVAAQMESLVTTLLAIARSQSGVISAQLQAVDLAAILQQTWRPHAVAAAQRNLSISWRLPQSAAVRADPAMLAPLLDNLISNAVAYTPAGGQIEFAITFSAEGTRLGITNTCENLTVADLPHLFEPFWRKDPARTSGMRCGLGLSLVAAYASAMGITVSTELPAAGRFGIVLGFAARGMG